MSFNFDMYDDDSYNEPVITEPKKEPVKVKESVKIGQNKGAQPTATFNFDMYYSDEAAPSSKPQPKGRSKNPFETKPVSKEDYAKMSISEKIQYAKDLDKELRYRTSEDLTKNIASGLTFGYSEDIPGLELSEDQDPFAAGAGQVIGSSLPIGGAAKLASYPVRALASQLPRVLQPLARFMQAFGTGATYETGQQSVNVARGKEFDAGQIPLTGAAFAAIDGLIHGATALGKRFLGLSPAHQAALLERQIIPEDLPKSQYETAEEVLNLLRQHEVPPGTNFPRLGGPPPRPPGAPPAAPSRPLNNRVRPNGEDLGLRPTTRPQDPQLADTVGDVFSPERFYNTTQAGRAIRNEISNIDEEVYRGVNELYANSRALNAEIENIQPQLVNRLEATIAELNEIPEPSDVQRRLLRTANNVVNRLAQYENVLDEAGNVIGREITGYTPINNQTLIQQVQSLRQIIDYDFAHGNTKNIFRPIINDLEDAAIRSAEQVGRPEAAEALREAKRAYRTWVEAFDNDYVRPFRDASNQDFSKLFRSTLDFDESNMVREILNLSENGQRLWAASQREIIEKHLGKYFDNPRAAQGREFDKAMRELEAVISPDQAQNVRDLLVQAQRRPPFRARSTPPRALTNDERIAARYTGKEPEDIQRLMNSRSGIRQLRKDLNTPEKQSAFKRLQQQKMRSIMREGNIEKDFTGDDLYRFLNKEHNYELFSEMLGEAETEALRQSAKEIGKQQVKSEFKKKNITKAAHKVVVFKSLEILLNLL